MSLFKLKWDTFQAEQVTRDVVVKLPHLEILVPAGDWILSEIEPTTGAPTRQLFVLSNARFREFCEPLSEDGERQLAAAHPVYIPQPSPPNPNAPDATPAGATETPGAGPV